MHPVATRRQRREGREPDMLQIDTVLKFSIVAVLCEFIPIGAALAERKCPTACVAAPANRVEQEQGIRTAPQTDDHRRMMAIAGSNASAAVTKQQERPASNWSRNTRLKMEVMDRWRPRYKDLRRRVY